MEMPPVFHTAIVARVGSSLPRQLTSHAMPTSEGACATALRPADGACVGAMFASEYDVNGQSIPLVAGCRPEAFAPLESLGGADSIVHATGSFNRSGEKRVLKKRLRAAR
eukprot:2462147-Pyramimonas_sp.AAC.1